MKQATSRLIPSLVFALAIVGCQDGGGDRPEPVTNSPPTISGNPAPSVDQDEEFAFTPTAADADGDGLSFSIQNAPSWAAFDADTGTLSGTPARADVGTYEDISISVSDGTATASLAPFSVEVIQVSNLRVTGVARDAPLPNAAITIHAGGREFTATADLDGSFTVPVELRAGDFDGGTLMTIAAIGDGSQAQVELVTVVGDLASLIEQAGEDETLDAADNDRINVTHLSTARYLLALDLDSGDPPTDMDALGAAEDSIDTSLLLRTAGIIKLIVDQSLIPIPEGETSLTMLRGVPGETTSRHAIETLLVDNGLMDDSSELEAGFAAALAQAIEETLADGSVLASFHADELTGVTVWTAAAHVDWVPASGDVLRFDGDGTGVSYERLDFAHPARGSFTWTINGGILEITYDESFRFSEFPFLSDPQMLVETYGFDQAVADFVQQKIDDLGGTQIQINTSWTGRTSRLVSGAQGRLHVSSQLHRRHDIDEVLQLLGWQGALPRAARTVASHDLVYTGSSIANVLNQHPASGESWAVPVNYRPMDPRVAGSPEEGFYPDIFRLDGDGTTSIGFLSSKSFEWTSSDEGLAFESGNARYVFMPFATDGHVYLALVSHYLDGTLERQSAQWVARSAGEGDLLESNLVRPFPEYWQSGINDQLASLYRSDGLLKSDFVFGYSFNADGTSRRIVANGGNCDAEVECFSFSDWTWHSDGVTITQERMADGFNRARIWKALRHEPESRSIVLEYEVIDFGGGYQFTVVPRLNPIEVMDLRTWDEGLAE